MINAFKGASASPLGAGVNSINCSIISTIPTNNDTHINHTLNIINSLAEGADQLVACTIIEMDITFRIICPIPFEFSQYRSTLTTTESKLTFDHILNNPKLKTETVEMKLPFETNEQRNNGYSQAANKLLELSDFIIALYNPLKTGHTGGTKETIDFAMQQNLPIIHINTSNPDHLAISSTHTNYKISYLHIMDLKESDLLNNIFVE